MKKILMFGRPGGTLGFTFDQHVIALNSDTKKRFSVDVIKNGMTYEEVSSYDTFWFYAKAFEPRIYETIINSFPDKQYIVGPNVLLDKPDIGISDPWDDWLINKAKFDLHLDQVKFYNDHVKKFLPEHKKRISTHIDKCMRLEIFDKDIHETSRDIDCLIYSKKRRYDKNFDHFRERIIKGVESRGLKYREIVYGSYKKEDFLNLLLRTKVMLNLSLDECPGILNYEAYYCNCHVIGSEHNAPSHYDHDLYVEGTDRMTEHYLVRDPEGSEKYLQKLDWFLEKYQNDEGKRFLPREYVMKHTSYERYCDDVFKIITSYPKNVNRV